MPGNGLYYEFYNTISPNPIRKSNDHSNNHLNSNGGINYCKNGGIPGGGNFNPNTHQAAPRPQLA